ncbi:MAG: malonyl-ACP O-methyltransferase BioC [Steroidobacteraceae bacterium]
MSNEYWLDPRLVRARFNRAADRYDAAAAVITELRQRLLERLDVVRLAPERVLDLGAGTGTGTRALKNRYPKAQVLGVDSAQRMLLQARAQRGWLRPFDLVCADAAVLPLRTAAFDLVFSHLMLPWCNSLDAVFEEIARVLRPGGLLSFSSLGPDTAYELRRLWRNLDASVHVHSFMDMHDVGDALVRAGFSDPVMDVETLTVTYPTMEHLLLEFRHLGLTNLAAGRRRGLGSQAKAQRLASGYDALRRADGALPVTVEVVYGHAWSVPRPTRVKGEVRVPVERIGRRQ